MRIIRHTFAKGMPTGRVCVENSLGIGKPTGNSIVVSFQVACRVGLGDRITVVLTAEDVANLASMLPPRTTENQALIAAAPDLLAVLERLEIWAGFMGGFEAPAWDDARAVIARAKG